MTDRDRNNTPTVDLSDLRRRLDDIKQSLASDNANAQRVTDQYQSDRAKRHSDRIRDLEKQITALEIMRERIIALELQCKTAHAQLDVIRMRHSWMMGAAAVVGGLITIAIKLAFGE